MSRAAHERRVMTMCKVTRIEWTYRTNGAESADGDSRVQVEVFRDGVLLAELGDGSESAASLERPDAASRVATFVGGENVTIARPATLYEEFPDGVRGHLDVRFRVEGRDAWQIRGIESTVVRAEQRPVLGAIGVYELRESEERFEFEGVGVLAAEPSDETAILELSY
jgi:hypothetical protein